MDPLSITAACVSLTATITKTSISVNAFVRAVRAARSDLDAVSRELASLKTLLELIAEDAKDVDAFPETLRKQIAGILANCELVLIEVQRLVEKYTGPGIIKGSKWALAGSEDVAKLRLSLEAHKSALEIALEMVTLSMTREIKADTSNLRDDTTAIKQDTTDILHEIARLRAQLPVELATLHPGVQGPSTTLVRYLDDLTSYAETVCWSGEDSDTDTETTDDAGTCKLVAKQIRSPPNTARSTEAARYPHQEREVRSQVEKGTRVPSPAMPTAPPLPSPGEILYPAKEEHEVSFEPHDAWKEGGKDKPQSAASQVRRLSRTSDDSVCSNSSAAKLDDESKSKEPLRMGLKDVLAQDNLWRAREAPVMQQKVVSQASPGLEQTAGAKPERESLRSVPPRRSQGSSEHNSQGPPVAVQSGEITEKHSDSDNTQRLNASLPSLTPSPFPSALEANRIMGMRKLQPHERPVDSRPDIKQVEQTRRYTLKMPQGTWRLGKTIAAGSRSKLKLVANEKTGELVVVKIYARDESQDVPMAREAALLNVMNHPYINSLRDVLRTNYHWYLLLEWAPGVTLSDYIQEHGPLTEKEARKFARQIGSALAYCHAHMFVHQSLKVQKILVSKSRDIKITGFRSGRLAKTYDYYVPPNTIIPPHDTVRSSVPAHCQINSYMAPAPEVLSGLSTPSWVDASRDVWSFGVIIWTMVRGGSLSEEMLSRLPESINLEELPMDISKEASDLLYGLLQKDPSKRMSLEKALSSHWMNKGYQPVPEHYVPHREPLTLPLDNNVIEHMTGFYFGSSDNIKHWLTYIIKSRSYQDASATWQRLQASRTKKGPKTPNKRGIFGFRKKSKQEDEVPEAPHDFSTHFRDFVTAPVVPVYYLVREKIEREQVLERLQEEARAIEQQWGRV